MKTLIAFLILAGSLSAQVPSRFPRTVTLTIAAGGSLSAGVNMNGCTVARMELPTITSAAITFQASEDGGTYRELTDFYGSAVSYPASTGNVIVVVGPGDWYSMKFMKVRSGTAASAVAQAGGASIKFTCRD
jgi:hypothetical protein